MVETTTKKAQQLIKTLLSEGHIDKTTSKWLCFTLLTKIHKPTPVGRPIISGCSGPTERISAFVDHLIQPIAQLQASYLKDTTDFINFIERIKLPKSAIHVSMDVTIQKKTKTKKKHNERVLPLYALHTKNFTNPPVPTRFLSEMLSLILLENSAI